MAEVISDNVPKGYYQLFYVYLFLGSLLYLLFIYIDLLRTRAKSAVMLRRNGSNANKKKQRKKGGKQNCDDADNSGGGITVANLMPRPRVHYGSFYLRLGAVCELINCVLIIDIPTD